MQRQVHGLAMPFLLLHRERFKCSIATSQGSSSLPPSTALSKRLMLLLFRRRCCDNAFGEFDDDLVDDLVDRRLDFFCGNMNMLHPSTHVSPCKSNRAPRFNRFWQLSRRSHGALPWRQTQFSLDFFDHLPSLFPSLLLPFCVIQFSVPYVKYSSPDTPKTPHSANLLANGITHLSKNTSWSSHHPLDGSFSE